MAKISQLPSLQAPIGNELVPVVSGDDTMVASLGQLVTAAIPRPAPIPFLVKGEPPLAMRANSAGQVIWIKIAAGELTADRDGLRAPVAPAPRSVPAPIPFLVDGEPPASLTTNARGQVTAANLASGAAYQLRGTTLAPAEGGWRAAPIPFLVAGEPPIALRINRRGQVYHVATPSGTLSASDAGGLRQVTASTAAAVAASAQVYVGHALTDQDVLTAQSKVIAAPADPRHAYIFVGGGQSNEWAHNDNPADPLYGTNPIYPDHALMFSGGVHRTAASKGDRTLVPMREAAFGAARSTNLTSWASHFIRDMEAATGVRVTVSGFIAAIGGQPLLNLGPGGLPDAWQAFEDGLVDMVAALRARGFDTFTVVYGWTQGEAETGLWRLDQRVRNLRVHFGRVRAAIKRICGMTAEPAILVTQTCSMRGLADRWDQPIRQAPLVLDAAGDGVLAGVFYHLPQSISPDGFFSIHMACIAQAHHGQMRARVTLDHVCGQGHRAIRPVAYRWRSATVLDVEFDAPAPLMLDTSGAMVSLDGLVNGHGFEFTADSGAVPAFNLVVTNRTATFTFASAPAAFGMRLGYAIAANDVEHDGPLTGGRGILRDTTDHLSLYDGSHQANWCAAFVLPVPRG